jgi:hypothetical protein
VRSLPNNEFPSGSKEDKKGPPSGGPFWLRLLQNQMCNAACGEASQSVKPSVMPATL